MARIGDTVDPRLLRSDTSGILRGSAAGAASLSEGLAGGMQSLATGIRKGKEAKGEIAGGRKFAKAMLDMHGEDSDIGKQMLPLIEFFDNPEARQSEQLGVVKWMNPLVGALTKKQEQDIAKLERDSLQAARNMDSTMRSAEHILNERKTKVREDLAGTAEKEAQARMLAARGSTKAFDETGTRIGLDGKMEYYSPGIQAMDLELVKDLAERKDALSTVDHDIAQLEEFRGLVEKGGSGWLQYARTAFGNTWASQYQQKFMQFKQDFAQKLAKARNGARVTDADVENAKKAVFSLNMSEEVNLDVIDSFINELKSRGKEVQAADKYLRTNGKLLGYTSIHPELWEGSGVSRPPEGAGGATSRLGGLRARNERTGDRRLEATTTGPDGRPVATGGRPVTASLTGPEAAEFTTLLSDSNFTARDLAKFRTGTDAEMGALLTDLRERGLAAHDLGKGLSAEDKEILMTQFVTQSEMGFDDLSPAEQQAFRDRRAARKAARENPPEVEAVLPDDPLDPVDPEDHNVDLRVSRTVPSIRPPNRIPEWFEGGTDQGTGQADLYKRLKDRPGVPGTYEEFLQLPDAEKVSLRDDYIASAPRAEIVDGTPGKIPREIKSSSTLLGSRLPKTTMASTRELTYAPEAKLRVSPEFSPGLAERKSLRKRGILMANLDANHSGNKKGTKTPVKRVIEPVMIIPDGSTKDTRTRAQSAVRLMDDLYSRVHGRRPKRKVNGRVKTTTENRGRGRAGIMHTELFAVTDNKMVNYLKTDEGAREYTGILRRVFGDLEGMRWFLPHSEKRQGATTDKGSSEVDLALHFMKYL